LLPYFSPPPYPPPTCNPNFLKDLRCQQGAGKGAKHEK